MVNNTSGMRIQPVGLRLLSERHSNSIAGRVSLQGCSHNMDVKKMKILILIASLALLGCQPQTDIREYTIDDYHVVVGVLEKQGKQQLIMSHDGQLWEVPEGVSVSSKPLTLESFQRVTK